MFAFLLASIGIASAQQTITVTGTVVAESDGQPVAGAYVLVNGTTIGTITDAEGRFGIKAVPADAKEIIVTFLGMSTASAKVSTEPLHIVMKADATYLEDVVVVAYGSAKREAMTGSVTSVKGDQIASAPVASVDKALAGKLAGVSVTVVHLQSTHPRILFGLWTVSLSLQVTSHRAQVTLSQA